VHPRPSHPELSGKIRNAKQALLSTGFLPSSPSKLATNFDECSLFTEEEQKQALFAVFDEIRAEDYVGLRPPERSYEPKTKDQELFAFHWNSEFFGRFMYLKFSLAKTDKGGLHLRLHSLHPSRRVK
jgi:hypothetical protein